MDARLANFRNYRPLSTPAVLGHLTDFGLDEDIAAHNAIRGLSGGQKAKLVLAGGSRAGAWKGGTGGWQRGGEGGQAAAAVHPAAAAAAAAVGVNRRVNAVEPERPPACLRRCPRPPARACDAPARLRPRLHARAACLPACLPPPAPARMLLPRIGQ